MIAGPVALAAYGRARAQQHGHGWQPCPPRELPLITAPRSVLAERVDHGRQAPPQARGDDLVEQGEGVGRCLKVVLSAAHDAPQLVGGDYFLRPVPPCRPGGLSRAGQADQDYSAGSGMATVTTAAGGCRPRVRQDPRLSAWQTALPGGPVRVPASIRRFHQEAVPGGSRLGPSSPCSRRRARAGVQPCRPRRWAYGQQTVLKSRSEDSAGSSAIVAME